VVKAEGRKRAEHRALRAIKKRVCSYPINRPEATAQMRSVWLASPGFRHYPFEEKSVYIQMK